MALVPVVLPVTLADTDLARDLLAAIGGISARDAVHAAVMLNGDVDHVATFDRGFDRVGRVTRVGNAAARNGFQSSQSVGGASPV